ncbi:AraC family transcriptional regulator [Actinomadura sp. DC4]|uniref:AraC family transcriptional regulator n=1 Tax=Actinomadura sp. DC4 TaxID=3055069 RepID=UPI0025B1799B|nr:AraC family transcriptional regulator [Actinomadura sp. DC4]MDN3354215.1 AraC family transcriptional regulator [Actinomadura sp. DC4]
MHGFTGERISVLARPLMRQALDLPLTSRLLVTDCGHFPYAADHLRSRTNGSPQAIVIICVEGAGWCRLPSGRAEVEAGQALVIPAGVPHEYGAAGDDPWTIWWLHLGGADVAELVGALTGPVVRVGDVYRAVSLIDEVLTLMERDDSVRGRQAAAGAAWHLLALLAASQTGAPASRTEAIHQAQRYLREHLGARTSVAELATLARLSPSHFAALFRRATGTGVLQYQTRLRMSRARELLDTTDRSVAEIARALGYADPFYFSRQFRSVHGTSPSAYRTQNKG